MDYHTGKYYTALFELDQLSAQVNGELTLEDLFIQIPVQTQPHELTGHPCYVNKMITCSRDLNDSCQGCPEYKEKDGE